MSNLADPAPQNRKQSRDEGRAIGAFYPAGHRGRVSRRIGKRLEKFGAAVPVLALAVLALAFNATDWTQRSQNRSKRTRRARRAA